MNFAISGKSSKVFERINEMAAKAKSGGAIIYEGNRNLVTGEAPVRRLEIFPDGKWDFTTLEPAPSQNLLNHSPTGFEWGYLGSGPAQIALALLLDATSDKAISLKYHQQFKERFVAGWSSNWRINADQIVRWVKLRQFHEQQEGGYAPDVRD